MMLSFFRQHFQGSDSKSTMTAMAVLFAIGIVLPQFMQHYRLGKQWVVEVDGEKIGLDEFKKRVQREAMWLEMVRAQLGGKFSVEQLGINGDPVQRAIGAVAQNAMLSNVAQEIDLHVNAETIKKRILEMLPSGRTLKEVAAAQHVKVAELEEEIKQETINEIVSNLSLGGLFVPEFIIKSEYQERYGKKKYELVYFKGDSKNIKASDDELKAFYEMRVKEGGYCAPETRKGYVVEFDLGKAKLQADDIESYYHSHKRNFVKTKPRVQVKLFSGENLENISKDNLSDYQVKTLPLFERGTHSKELERQAFALEVGEFSPVFTDEGKNVVVQLVERVPSTYKSLEEVKSEINKILLQEELAEKINDLDLADSEAVEQFITNYGGIKKDITVNNPLESAIAKVLFALKDNEFGLVNGKSELVFLATITPKAVLSYDAVKAKVAKEYKEYKAEQILASKIKEAAEMAKKESLATVAKHFGGELVTTDWLNRDSAEWNSLPEGVPVTPLMSMNDLHAINAVVEGDKAMVAKLVGIEDADKQEYTKQKESLKKELLQEYLGAIQGGFIASLERNAKIRINNNILNG